MLGRVSEDPSRFKVRKDERSILAVAWPHGLPFGVQRTLTENHQPFGPTEILPLRQVRVVSKDTQ